MLFYEFVVLWSFNELNQYWPPLKPFRKPAEQNQDKTLKVRLSDT